MPRLKKMECENVFLFLYMDISKMLLVVPWAVISNSEFEILSACSCHKNRQTPTELAEFEKCQNKPKNVVHELGWKDPN